MKRYQLFDTPHKALRLAFSQLLTLAGKTDFSQSQEVKALQQKMKSVFSMVKSHSHHEDDICFADLDKIAPHATQHDREEHIRLHERFDALIVKVKTLVECVQMGQNESIAGRDLYTDLCNLHAEMLIHMMEEERDTQPIFWKYMTDDALQAFEPRIMANMTPDMSALWMHYILPSHTHNERVGMFTGMKATAPPFVFEGMMSLAQEVLTTEEFELLEAVFEPAMV